MAAESTPGKSNSPDRGILKAGKPLPPTAHNNPVEAVGGFVTKIASDFAKGMEEGEETRRKLFGTHPKAATELKAVEGFVTKAASNFAEGMKEGEAMSRQLLIRLRPKGP